MAIHPQAGQLAPASALIDVVALQRAYFENRPDPGDPRQRVAFGTSGHRGTPGDNTCPEANYGEVAWSDFGAAPTPPAKTGRTGKGQPYPIDDAIRKAEVYEAVTTGFAAV